mmetsp:Transcript_30389/g.48694  ORF Transcript_30389/g.48694 Transcript_30389/m.48694 type:complete len:207 (+) Transcript_30389:985-1605(+)
MPDHSSLPKTLHRKGGVQHLSGAPVPPSSPPTMLDLFGCRLLPTNSQRFTEPTPKALDANRRRDSVILLPLVPEIAISLLQGHGCAMVQEPHQQSPEDHVKQDHGQAEGAVVMWRLVSHVKKPVSHGHKTTLSDTLALPSAFLVLYPKDRVNDLVLVSHKEADLLHDPHQGCPIELSYPYFLIWSTHFRTLCVVLHFLWLARSLGF